MCHCIHFCIYSSVFICTEGEKRHFIFIAKKLLTLKNVYTEQLVLTFLDKLHEMVSN